MCSLGSGDNLLAGNNLLAPSPRTGFSRLPSTVRSASPVTLVVLGRGETGNELNDSIGNRVLGIGNGMLNEGIGLDSTKIGDECVDIESVDVEFIGVRLNFLSDQM
jgi:hypothetical protein